MAIRKKDLEYYVNLRWSYTIEEECHDGQSYFVIRVNELPGISTDAETIEIGMKEIKQAIEAAIMLYLKHGEPIPEPVSKEKYKGRIAYRTSSERHHLIAQIAHEHHSSLSKTLDLLVDAGVEKLGSNRRRRPSI